MNTVKKTDWTNYYSKKKSWFSIYTQKFTLDKIIEKFDIAVDKNGNLSIIELGGGNSCFAESFCKLRRVMNYDIIDNNELSIELFRKKKIENVKLNGYRLDLRQQLVDVTDKYDFVYSVGLIEHFIVEERTQVIKNHFQFCKKGGYVLITFPTPTLKYRFCRKIMELIGVWQFWDETPLKFEDIQSVLKEHGQVISVELNRKLFLSQLIVLVKKTIE